MKEGLQKTRKSFTKLNYGSDFFMVFIRNMKRANYKSKSYNE